MELFIEQGDLATKELWDARLDEIKAKVQPSTKEELKQAILDAVKVRIPSKKFGLFLSGGVDSSFIALQLKKNGADFICYTVGIEGSPDIERAQALAKELDLTLRHKTLSLDEVEHVLKILAPWYLSDARLKEENLAVLFGVATVEYAAAKLAEEDGVNILFGGLGSEEIFAGYQRHEKAQDINEECWRGLHHMWQRDLIRDVMLCKHLKLDARTPLLDEAVIKMAMGIPADQKIKGDCKKYVLREIAQEEGLPKEFAWRKKLGAQYGSRFDRAITRLAKREGYRFKHEYLKSLNQ